MGMLSLKLGPQLTAPAMPKRGRGRPPLPVAVVEAREQRREQAERQRAQEMHAKELAVGSNPVNQARAVFHPGNRLSTLVGMVLGGFVPLASYTLIHVEVRTRPELWVLVGGGLVYSAISVYTWAKEAFHYRLKALGFVVLLEGTLTFCSIQWLSLAGLAILMILNGVTAAVTLAKPRTEEV